MIYYCSIPDSFGILKNVIKIIYIDKIGKQLDHVDLFYKMSMFMHISFVSLYIQLYKHFKCSKKLFKLIRMEKVNI